ncbi:uncharacterized protein [Fopius arisanus]|uniref:Uncharacterized protein n=1 Tax=Fopius arisanus TaxID=64838 RepID=A0A9R1U3B8_9HYME|nr:PREDICTED: uncharacterized protein LOC105268765 [Fopius arisanus]
MKIFAVFAIVLAVAAAAPSLGGGKAQPPKFINRPHPPSGSGRPFGRSIELESRDVHGSVGAEAGVSKGEGSRTEGHVGVHGKIDWDEPELESRDVHGSVGAEAGVSKGEGSRAEGHVGVHGKIDWDEPELESRDVHTSVGAEAGVSKGEGSPAKGHVGVSGKIEWDEPELESRDVHTSVGAEAGVSKGEGSGAEGHIDVSGKIEWDEDAAFARGLNGGKAQPPKFINRPRPPTGSGRPFAQSRDVHGSVGVSAGASKGKGDRAEGHVGVNGKIEWDEPEIDLNDLQSRKHHGHISIGASKHGKKGKWHIGVGGKIQWDEPELESRDVHGSVGASAGASTGKGGKTEGHVGVNGKIDWDEDQ